MNSRHHRGPRSHAIREAVPREHKAAASVRALSAHPAVLATWVPLAHAWDAATPLTHAWDAADADLHAIKQLPAHAGPACTEGASTDTSVGGVIIEEHSLLVLGPRPVRQAVQVPRRCWTATPQPLEWRGGEEDRQTRRRVEAHDTPWLHAARPYGSCGLNLF